MRYSQTLNIITKGYFNLRKMLSLNGMLRMIDNAAKKAQVTPQEALKVLTRKTFGDWHAINEIFDTASQGESLMCARYAIIADMTMNEVNRIKEIIEGEDAYDYVEQVNSLLVNIRIYCSNLFKAMDIATNIYHKYRAELIIKELSNCVMKPELRERLIAGLTEQAAISADVENAIAELGTDMISFNKIIKAAANMLIVGDLIIDDEDLFKAYCARVNQGSRVLLDEFKYTLTRNDITAVMEATPETQEDVADKLYEKLSQMTSDISVIEDYQLLFDDITSKEDKKIRTADITRIDIGILDEAIACGKTTDHLRNEITKDSSAGGVERSNAFN